MSVFVWSLFMRARGGLHGEASGAGDVLLWRRLTSSSEVSQTTNSRSVCCQPVGHLGGSGLTLRALTAQAPSSAPSFQSRDGRAGAPECTGSRHERWGVTPVRREKNPSFLKVQWKVRSPVSLGELLTALPTLTSTESWPAGSKRRMRWGERTGGGAGEW